MWGFRGVGEKVSFGRGVFVGTFEKVPTPQNFLVKGTIGIVECWSSLSSIPLALWGVTALFQAYSRYHFGTTTQNGHES